MEDKIIQVIKDEIESHACLVDLYSRHQEQTMTEETYYQMFCSFKKKLEGILEEVEFIIESERIDNLWK